MGADLLDDLNKQTIAELSRSYLWPSVAFWVGNVIFYFVINNYSVDLNSMSNLSGEVIGVGLSFFAGMVVFTAWVIRLIVPFFYRVLQGVDVNFSVFRQGQVNKYLKLKKSEYDFAVSYENWISKQRMLLNSNHAISGQKVLFKDFRINLVNFVGKKITIDLLSDDAFYFELRSFSGLLELNKDVWAVEKSYVEAQEELTNYYQSVLNEIKIQIDLLASKRSKIIEELIYKFPQNKEWILPSRFGNCWAAIESYTIVNYSVTLSLLWSRLLAFIPKDYYEIIVQSKARIDTFVAGIVLFALFSTTWFFLFFQKFHILIVLLYVLISLIIFLLTYLMGINSVISYGKLIKSAVDLYRHEVIKQMGLSIPSDIEAERVIWKDLQKLWTASLGTNLKFNIINKPEIYQ